MKGTHKGSVPRQVRDLDSRLESFVSIPLERAVEVT